MPAGGVEEAWVLGLAHYWPGCLTVTHAGKACKFQRHSPRFWRQHDVVGEELAKAHLKEQVVYSMRVHAITDRENTHNVGWVGRLTASFQIGYNRRSHVGSSAGLARGNAGSLSVCPEAFGQ